MTFEEQVKNAYVEMLAGIATYKEGTKEIYINKRKTVEFINNNFGYYYIREYYDNGNLFTVGKYIGHKKQGEFVSYFENGKLKSKSNYKRGKITGESLGWWEAEEKLRYRDVYKNGKIINQEYYSFYQK